MSRSSAQTVKRAAVPENVAHNHNVFLCVCVCIRTNKSVPLYPLSAIVALSLFDGIVAGRLINTFVAPSVIHRRINHFSHLNCAQSLQSIRMSCTREFACRSVIMCALLSLWSKVYARTMRPKKNVRVNQTCTRQTRRKKGVVCSTMLARCGQCERVCSSVIVGVMRGSESPTPLFRISVEFPRHTHTQVYGILYVRFTQHKHWPRLQARPTSMLPMSDSNRVFHFVCVVRETRISMSNNDTHTERAHYATACCDRDATQINQSHIYIRGLPRSGLNC